MKRLLVNIIIDTLAAMVMLGVIATGIILRFVLPPRSGRMRTLWNMSRHQWGDLHFWLALVAVAIVLLHLALHWDWVVSVVRRRMVGPNQGPPSKRLKAISGVASVLIVGSILTGFWWISAQSVRQAAMHQAGNKGHAFTEASLRGSMTLAQTAATLRCSVEQVKQRLDVAVNTPESTRLGQITKEKGVTMREIRNRLKPPPQQSQHRGALQ